MHISNPYRITRSTLTIQLTCFYLISPPLSVTKVQYVYRVTWIMHIWTMRLFIQVLQGAKGARRGNCHGKNMDIGTNIHTDRQTVVASRLKILWISNLFDQRFFNVYLWIPIPPISAPPFLTRVKPLKD